MVFEKVLFGDQLNAMAVKRINELRVLHLLYREGELTNQELKDKLGLSAPTITQAVQKFRQLGLLADGEELESSGGRKSRKIAFQYGAMYSVGVEIRPHHVDIVLVDMNGRKVDGEFYKSIYENAPEYWGEINNRINKLIKKNTEPSKILGIGIAFPGEVSFNGDYIERATVLGLKNEPLDNIRKHFDHDIYIENGARAAGFGAIWRSDSVNDAIYIVITDDGVAGAVIVDNRIFRGGGKGGAFGHVTLDPHGKRCFCGARGCWSAYSALSNLSSLTDDDLGKFFEGKDNGTPELVRAWDEYLGWLSEALYNVILSTDLDVIIGGKIVGYLRPDLERLSRDVMSHPVLRGESRRILLDDIEENTLAIGAATLFIGRLFSGKLSLISAD